MNLPQPCEHASQWLRGVGPEGDVVLSSRVRLARNIASFPFLSRASEGQRSELQETCRQHILDSDPAPQMLWVDLMDSTRLDRRLLFERHLISHQHREGEPHRGVALSSDEALAIMINEEDHLRMQVLRSGMDLDSAYGEADRVDDLLEGKLEFAYSSKLGYLTACPTNVGTGIRVSVMLHLPAMNLTGEIDKLRRAAKDMNLAVRGYYGEGTDAAADLLQVSNQTTLGRSERQILTDFQESIIPQMIEYERKARQTLADQRTAVLDDRIWRAWATLGHARLLGADEALQLLSYVRLGVCLERIEGLDLSTVNELFLLTQPAHLQKMAGRRLSGPERREMRAGYVRQRIGA